MGGVVCGEAMGGERMGWGWRETRVYRYRGGNQMARRTVPHVARSSDNASCLAGRRWLSEASELSSHTCFVHSRSLGGI